MVTVNYMAILAAGVAQFILGALWYGPLFGKKWAKLMGFEIPDKAKMKAMQKQMAVSYGITALCSLLTAFVLANYLYYTNVGDASKGAIVGFFVWLGFVFTIQVTQSLWAGKSKVLVLIDSAYYLVGYMMMGVILTLWK